MSSINMVLKYVKASISLPSWIIIQAVPRPISFPAPDQRRIQKIILNHTVFRSHH